MRWLHWTKWREEGGRLRLLTRLKSRLLFPRSTPLGHKCFCEEIGFLGVTLSAKRGTERSLPGNHRWSRATIGTHTSMCMLPATSESSQLTIWLFFPHFFFHSFAPEIHIRATCTPENMLSPHTKVSKMGHSGLNGHTHDFHKTALVGYPGLSVCSILKNINIWEDQVSCFLRGLRFPVNSTVLE